MPGMNGEASQLVEQLDRMLNQSSNPDASAEENLSALIELGLQHAEPDGHKFFQELAQAFQEVTGRQMRER